MIDQQYLKTLEAQKRAAGTIKNEKWVLNTIDRVKPLETILKDDLLNFFNDFDKPQNTLLLFQTITKKYFRAIGKPELVEWIKKTKVKDTLHPNDILTSDDVNRMLQATDNHYWQAIIAFLFETGCRISEARALKYGDFTESDHGMIVNIPTSKTAAGLRKVILPFSAQYIRNLELYSGASKKDAVFKIQDWQTNNMLRKIGKDAGITKPISAHKFRHGQATDLVRRGYNEAIIRKKLGWSPTSTMIARYQHLNDDDVINATLENHGKLPISASIKSELIEADKINPVDTGMIIQKQAVELEELRTAQKDSKKQVEMIMALLQAGEKHNI